MPERKTDIRTLQTQSQYIDAFVHMVYRQQGITVASLSREIGKSRNTFYLHFESLQELACSVCQRILERFKKEALEIGMVALRKDPQWVGHFMIALMEEEPETAFFLMGSSWADSMLPYFTQATCAFLCEEYQKVFGQDPLSCASITFFVNGLIFTMQGWFCSDRTISAASIVERLGKISREGIWSMDQPVKISA